MNQQVKRLAARASAAFGALGLGAALTVVSLLAPSVPIANAFTASGGQVQTRSIYMSTSTPSATGQSYFVSFKPATSGSIGGIVVDFCANDPIIGDSCTAPDSPFTVGASPTVSYDMTNPPTGTAPTSLPGGTSSAWTATSANSGRTLKLDASTPQNVTAGTLYGFVITGVTNPPAPTVSGGTTNTFYGRLVTYATDGTDFTNYAAAGEGNIVDYGGFALSTATNINITAKVQETLSFCVVSVDLGTGNQCGDGTANDLNNVPNLTLGHGTTVKTIDNSQIDTATAYMQISTNASTGAIIRMHALNACANAGISTDGGTNCAIPGIGSNQSDATLPYALAAATPNTGAAAFGLYVGSGYTTTGIDASTGTISPDANYHSLTNVTEPATVGGALGGVDDLHFGMDNTTGTGVTGTYGDTIASTNGAPCNTVNAHLVFGVIASLTTPAGIYTGAESLIATGQF